MFWKNVNPRQWSIKFRKKSIIFRLTVLYTFSIMVVLAIISGVLYFSLEEDLERHGRKLSTSTLFNQSNNSLKHSMIHYLHHEKNETLEDYWETLLTTSFLGIILAGGLGFFLAYHNMHPIKNIINAMKKTSIDKLEYRLNAENWPKEFIDLANHFNQMLNRLEMSFKSLSQFSADLAHDLRTPIHNLKGEAEICLMKPRSLFEYQQIIGSSLEEYERLSRIIENVLFLARAESPQSKLRYKKILVHQTILSILDYYMPMAEEKCIKLACIGDEEDKIMLSVDELLFQRVLHNLLSNALRYTLSDGTVTVKISSLGEKVILQIIDTGIGIAEEHLPHLFERFYRTDSARTQESGGNGLGLPIVKSILDLHQAEILIQSQLGKGTTVSLIFPSLETPELSIPQ